MIVYIIIIIMSVPANGRGSVSLPLTIRTVKSRDSSQIETETDVAHYGRTFTDLAPFW